MTRPSPSGAGRPIALLPFCALMLAGCSLNLAVLLWNWRGNDVSRKFVEQPGFAYWLFFIGIQGAIWWPLVAHLFPIVRNGMARAATVSDHVGAAVLAFLTFASGFAFYATAHAFGWIPEPSEWPLAGHTPKMNTLTAMGLVPACLAVLGIVYAPAASRGAAADAASAGEAELTGRIQGLLDARASFDRSLKALGLLLSLATLATASLRNAVIAFSKACDAGRIECPGIDASLLAAFPMEMVLMFGLAYSAVILLVAVPSGLRLQGGCDGLIRDAVGNMPSSLSGLDAWLDRKASLRKALGLEGGLWNASKDAIYILGPVLSALLSTLIPG